MTVSNLYTSSFYSFRETSTKNNKEPYAKTIIDRHKKEEQETKRKIEEIKNKYREVSNSRNTCD